MNPRAWSFLTIEGIRQYGGNAGYRDDPAKVYRYDSDVANHRQIQTGDIIIVRSKREVLGIAVIERIVEGEDSKERLRCPVCQANNIKERVTKRPRWGCKNGHAFDEPIRQYDTVRTFEAHYEESFRTIPPTLTTSALHDAVLRPSDQMSIKEIDLAKVERYLLEKPDCYELVIRYTSVIEASLLLETQRNDDEPQSIIEMRRRVLREIAVRRGQVQFRQRLIRRYGEICQISRCAFSPLIEAAHIRPYAQSADNGVQNGLLLRTDLHTLFDLGLLAVHPTTIRVVMNPNLLHAGYAAFDGTQLFVNSTQGPDREALRRRWEFFEARLGSNAVPTMERC